MKKMDEIKNLVSQPNFRLYHSQRGGMYVEDVSYLLSIIEQAEKELDLIEHISSPRIDDFAINQLARNALKAIRG